MKWNIHFTVLHAPFLGLLDNVLGHYVVTGADFLLLTPVLAHCTLFNWAKEEKHTCVYYASVTVLIFVWVCFCRCYWQDMCLDVWMFTNVLVSSTWSSWHLVVLSASKYRMQQGALHTRPKMSQTYQTFLCFLSKCPLFTQCAHKKHLASVSENFGNQTTWKKSQGKKEHFQSPILLSTKKKLRNWWVFPCNFQERHDLYSSSQHGHLLWGGEQQ